MCKNVFKNDKEKERKEEFTKLFVLMVQSAIKSSSQPMTKNNK